VIALAILSWNAAAGGRGVARREGRALICTLLFLAVAQATLLTLHPILDGKLDVSTQRILPRSHFFAYHQIYLWISTTQWGVALAHIWVVLAIWRQQDRAKPANA